MGNVHGVVGPSATSGIVLSKKSALHSPLVPSGNRKTQQSMSGSKSTPGKI